MAGGGNVAIRGANAKSENAAAHVTDNALHVKVVGTVQPLSVLPVRQTNQLHNAQVFDNVTTTASGTEVSTASGRHFLVFYDITVANTPTSIRLVPQFSHDGGSNWYDYSVDQWVEMRFVPGQMPVHECCPLNYVGGELFRLRIDAVGTTAANTFTVSAWVEVCD